MLSHFTLQVCRFCLAWVPHAFMCPECRECKFCKSGKTNLCGKGLHTTLPEAFVLHIEYVGQSELHRARE